MRILIAEDDSVSRMILQRAVQKFGYECLAAEDGEKALQIYRETPGVNVVISDWMMPVMDGLELCRRLREEQREGDYTFFVFLTALGDKEHLLEGMQAGADDYLAKPLDREQLQVRLIAASRVTSLHQQLTEQKAGLERLNLELFTAARQDNLTHLGNRLLLREDLATASGRVERYGHRYCALLCDVDSFKAYNDHYGHLAGDKVLKKVAGVIAKNLRSGDTAYRYDGEEFLALLPEQTLEQAKVVAERLRRSVENLAIPHQFAKPAGIVTISIGLSALPPGEPKSLETLLKEADDALYRAKEAGKNRVATYEETDEGPDKQ
jgi:two-component system cell cycle response regulator